MSVQPINHIATLLSTKTQIVLPVFSLSTRNTCINVWTYLCTRPCRPIHQLLIFGPLAQYRVKRAKGSGDDDGRIEKRHVAIGWLPANDDLQSCMWEDDKDMVRKEVENLKLEMEHTRVAQCTKHRAYVRFGEGPHSEE